MARSSLKVSIQFDRIYCRDEGDGWGNAEPYLWNVFFKIDGSTVHVTDSLTLSGNATVWSHGGSHGNLGDTDVDAGDTVHVPQSIGLWSTTLSPIPTPQSLQSIVADVPAIVGVVCVLMEEDNVSDDGAEAGRVALVNGVRQALDHIIATRTFSNQNVSTADIQQFLDAIKDQVKNAIQNQQNFFENLWSAINPDDTIGSQIFFWNTDQLTSQSSINFSQRWQNEGDWELFGNVTATPIITCPANLIATLLGASPASMDGLRNFRSAAFAKRPVLEQWWNLTTRHAPALTRLVTQEPKVKQAVQALLKEAPTALHNLDGAIPEVITNNVHTVLSALAQSRDRRARIDAKMALDLLGRVKGQPLTKALDLANANPPGRYQLKSNRANRLPLLPIIRDPIHAIEIHAPVQPAAPAHPVVPAAPPAPGGRDPGTGNG